MGNLGLMMIEVSWSDDSWKIKMDEGWWWKDDDVRKVMIY